MLAAESGIDPRTAHRALEYGITSIRGWHVQQRILRAARALGIVLPERSTVPSARVLSLVPRLRA